MRILIVTPYLAFPGEDGGGTVMFNFIKNLSARHEIAYLTFVRQPGTPGGAKFSLLGYLYPRRGS